MFLFVLYPSLSSKIKSTVLHFDQVPLPSMFLHSSLSACISHTLNVCVKNYCLQLLALMLTSLLWLSLSLKDNSERTAPCLCVLGEIFGFTREVFVSQAPCRQIICLSQKKLPTASFFYFLKSLKETVTNLLSSLCEYKDGRV